MQSISQRFVPHCLTVVVTLMLLSLAIAPGTVRISFMIAARVVAGGGDVGAIVGVGSFCFPSWPSKPSINNEIYSPCSETAPLHIPRPLE